MAWLAIAVFLLWAMKESFVILYVAHKDGEPMKLGLSQLMSLPYHTAGGPVVDQTDGEHLPEHNKDAKISEQAKGNAAAVSSSNVDAVGIAPQLNPSHTDLFSTKNGPRSITSYTGSLKAPVIKITITMPSEHGLRSWRWYEAILETLAVGIYLYATFVLPSTVFMSGDMALSFATIMTICLSAVRILGSLF